MTTRPLLALTTIALLATSLSFAQSESKDKRNTKEWSLKKGLALQGYDPVAYFPEGGGKPVEGKKSISLKRDDVTYHFANEENRARFKANPDRYEPAYGGWCAWAMREGGKTEVDPKTFIVKDDRLFVFYNGIWGNTKKSWLGEGTHSEHAKKSDGQWKKISGEGPRQVKAKEDKKKEAAE